MIAYECPRCGMYHERPIARCHGCDYEPGAVLESHRPEADDE